jgi:hypothetical protein
MGFDRRPTRNDIAAAHRRILAALASYAVRSLVTAVVLVRYFTHTLASLGESARQVASGNHDRRLSANTTISEVHDLAADLEQVRSELVGVNAKWRTEMAERERVEVQRQALESRLRRRQRLDAVRTLASGVGLEREPRDEPGRNSVGRLQPRSRHGLPRALSGCG